MKHFGYVSGADKRDRNMQLFALADAGCQKIFSDISGRDGRSEMFQVIAPGDTLTIWRLDKFASSVEDLVELIKTMRQIGIRFNTLQEKLEPDTIDTQQFRDLVAAMADIEKSLGF